MPIYDFSKNREEIYLSEKDKNDLEKLGIDPNNLSNVAFEICEPLTLNSYLYDSDVYLKNHHVPINSVVGTWHESYKKRNG